MSDSDVLQRTRTLVGKSNQLLAALLEHLAEVEARGIFRLHACSSLYTYCIYELRLSEDAASRRSSAAKLVRRFSALLEAVANGELHLTGLLLLGPHLTDENHAEVLTRAKFRTKKEIERLVRQMAPLPAVPDRIEPIGPELPRAPGNPTWTQMVAALCGPVRELPAGERPGDWANDTNQQPLNGDETLPEGETPGLVRAPAELPPVTGPQGFQIQFTTTEEHVKLIDRARALLPSGPAAPSLSEIHLQAMRLLVEKMEKKRFGSPKRTGHQDDNLTTPQRAPAPTAQPHPPRQRGATSKLDPPHQHGTSKLDPPHQHGTSKLDPPHQRGDALRDDPPRGTARSRHIPAAERRAVFARDGGQCGYVDERGRRCPDTSRLEIHHLHAFARGGAHDARNLGLRCRAHNSLAAETDFGPHHIETKAAQRHEPASHASRK